MLVNLKRHETIAGMALRGAKAPLSVHAGPHPKAKSIFSEVF